MSQLKPILLLFLAYSINSIAYSQSWEKWYGPDDLDMVNEGVIEDYDKGVLISGNILDFSNLLIFPQIIKTDINGDTLWSKILISSEYLDIKKAKKTNDGGTLICGGFKINNETKPFAAKISPCGEKEWCTVFESYKASVRAFDIVENSSGDIGLIVNSFDDIDELYLFKLNSLGEFLWKKPVCSRSKYPDSQFPFGWRVEVTSNNDFLVSGNVYWKHPWEEVMASRPLFSIIDEEGYQKWVLPFGVQDTIIGRAFKVHEKANGNFISVGFYWEDQKNKKSSNNMFYPVGRTGKPDQIKSDFRDGFIMEFDSNGNEVNHFIADFSDIDPAFKYQVFTDIFFVDSVAIIGGLFDDETPMNTGEIVIDTNFFDEEFNVYHRTKHENGYDTFAHSLTFDNKILCSSNDLYSSSLYHMYLTKLNRNLEQDSIYTANYDYDYLCDQEIESGTIDCDDCNLILATDQIHTNKENPNQQVSIQLAPNPASEKIRLNFRNMEYQEQVKLQIISILGQQVYETTIFNGQISKEVDIYKWQQGVYLVQLYSNGKIIGQNRFVKM